MWPSPSIKLSPGLSSSPFRSCSLLLIVNWSASYTKIVQQATTGQYNYMSVELCCNPLKSSGTQGGGRIQIPSCIPDNRTKLVPLECTTHKAE